VKSALERLVAGSLLVFDYGDTAENLLPRRQDGTLRTYRAHHLGPHPLDEPGETDITADVNFSALASIAAAAGARVELLRQDDFLTDLGLRVRLSELRHSELEAARSGDEMERLRLRTLKTEAETLLHPRGLGDFRVLVAYK
jgi:SAM-dependent MidA family methyltransferase